MRKQLLWIGLGWFYILLMCVWLVLRSLSGDALWWIAVMSSVAVYLFVPLPILLMVSVWRRRWKLLLGLSLPTVAFILLYGALFLPSFPAWEQRGGRSLTVMSYNVKLGNTNYLPLTQAIRAANADVVGLQELTPELIKPLSQELATDYPYTTLTSLIQNNSEAVGILSRFPIETQTYFPLPGKRYGINVQTQVEFLIPKPRMGLRAVVRIDDERMIQVATADLIHNPVLRTPLLQVASVATEHYKEKAIEMELLNQELHKEPLPFLFLCDCNMQDTVAVYAQLAGFARDSFREVGWGLGYTVNPRAWLNSRIDYIWHSDEFVALETTTGPDGQSDHLPVVTKFKLNSLRTSQSLNPQSPVPSAE